MWILVAEAMGALALFLFIVWWTLGPTQRRERDALRERSVEQAPRADGDPDDRTAVAAQDESGSRRP